jgi:hypothetical protein
MKTRLLIIVLVFVGVFGTAYADSDPNDDYRKFPLGDSYMYADSKHITDISLSWSESLPYGTITFDKRIDSDISIMIPKNIPRMMNLDFGTSLAVFYPDMLVEQIKETETDCFYHLRIPVNNEDEISIDTITVATGRWEPVTIDESKCDRIYKYYSETYELKADTSFSNLPPLKQFKSGISLDEIECKDDLVLIQKYDGSPSCVTEYAISKLIDRGWAKSSKNPLHIIIPYGASNSQDSNFVLQYDHFKSGNFIEITNQDNVSYDITGEHIPQTESFGFHIQLEPDEVWKNQIISNYDIKLTGKDLVTGKPFAWMNKTIHVQPRITPELPSDYPPEPDTGNAKYGLDMCSYYDDNGKHRYCMLEGWDKPASDLDCKYICRPPPTKD